MFSYCFCLFIIRAVEGMWGEGENSQGLGYFEDPRPILKIFGLRILLKNVFFFFVKCYLEKSVFVSLRFFM